MSRKPGAIVAALLGLIVWSAPLLGQGEWSGVRTRWTIDVETLRPTLRRDAVRRPQGIVSGVVFVTARRALGSSASVVVDLPIAHGSFGPSGSAVAGVPAASGSSFGSPYLGLEIGRPGRGAFSEIGFRPPLIAAPRSANDSAALAVGRFADLERADAFTPGLGAISALFGYGWSGAHGLRVQVRGGPVGQFLTAGTRAAPMALWLAYAAEAGYGIGDLDLTAGLAGRAMMTPLVAGASGATGHQAVAGFHLRVGRFHPGATLRVPIGGALSRSVGAVFGLDLGVPLR